MKKNIGTIILFLPLILTAYFFLLKPLYIITFGESTKGVIVDFDYHQDEGSTTYYAIVEYKRENGNIYKTSVGDNSNNDYNKTIDLYYLKNSSSKPITTEISNFIPFFFCFFFYFWIFLIVFLNRKFPTSED